MNFLTYFFLFYRNSVVASFLERLQEQAKVILLKTIKSTTFFQEISKFFTLSSLALFEFSKKNDVVRVSLLLT